MGDGITSVLRMRGISYIIVGITVLAAAVLIGTDPLIGGLIILALLFGVSVVFRPVFGLYAVLATLVIGQLIRIPAFGVGGAVLPNDLLVPVLITGWLLRGLFERRVGIPSSPLSWPLVTMALVFVVTFFAGAAQVPFLTSREQLASSLYIIRWLEYALLFFVVADIVRIEVIGRKIAWLLLLAAGVVAIAGFVQLRIYPDFSFMVPQGWDPHIGRLLSTWFDPNFLGGFLAFTICIASGIAIMVKGRRGIVLWILNAILFAALVLTFSRSAYAALLAGVAVLTFLQSRRMFFLFIIVATLIVTSVPRVQERVQGALNLDKTAQLRIRSWQNALTVYRDFPLTGVGYNTYRYVQVTYGFQKDAAEHSAGGSDSSLLTILVTTGPIGLVVYLWILWASLSLSWSAYRRGASSFTRGLGFGAFAGIVTVIVHSFFINSLLFPHMMETMAIVLGVLVGLRVRKGDGNEESRIMNYGSSNAELKA